MMYNHHFCQYPPGLCTIPLCSTITFSAGSSRAVSSWLLTECSQTDTIALHRTAACSQSDSQKDSKRQLFDVYTSLCYAILRMSDRWPRNQIASATWLSGRPQCRTGSHKNWCNHRVARSSERPRSDAVAWSRNVRINGAKVCPTSRGPDITDSSLNRTNQKACVRNCLPCARYPNG
jgi:hypothetical protein